VWRLLLPLRRRRLQHRRQRRRQQAAHLQTVGKSTGVLLLGALGMW